MGIGFNQALLKKIDKVRGKQMSRAQYVNIVLAKALDVKLE